jgi:hypothetical protein
MGVFRGIELPKLQLVDCRMLVPRKEAHLVAWYRFMNRGVTGIRCISRCAIVSSTLERVVPEIAFVTH